MFIGRGLITALLCILLSLSGCVGGRRAANQDPSEGDWVLVTTKHFRVYSDLDGKQVQELAIDLEKDLRLIAQAAFGTVNSSVNPTDVIIFSEAAHFHRYFRKSVGGVAYPRIPLLVESHHTVVTFAGLSTSMRQTLRHELVHDLFARNFGASPPWLSEGFAEYFSTVQSVDGEIHIGKALPHRVMTREFQPFSFSERGVRGVAIPRLMIPAPSALLAMRAHEFYGKEGDPSEDADASLQKAARYFGAWAFVHFLMDAKGHYSTSFDRFLSEVRSTSVQDAWAVAFAGVNSERLDQDFRDYLDAGTLAISALPYHEVGARQAPPIRILNAGEKHVLQAKLALAANGTTSETEELFSKQVDAAVRSEPPPAEAYYLRGMWAQSQKKYADAQREFNQAVQLAPQDPRFLRASVNSQIQRSKGQMTVKELMGFGPEIEKLEALATSSFEIFLAAHFFAATGETDRALILAKKAASLGPVDPFVLSEYARVLASCGDLKSAVATQRLALEFIYEHRELRKQFGDDLKQLETRAAPQEQRSTQ